MTVVFRKSRVDGMFPKQIKITNLSSDFESMSGITIDSVIRSERVYLDRGYYCALYLLTNKHTGTYTRVRTAKELVYTGVDEGRFYSKFLILAKKRYG